MTVVGLDIGTSGGKVTVLGADGQLIFEGSQEWFPAQAADGTSEHDPREWVSGLRSILDRAVAAGVDLGQVQAVGVTGQMQGATFLGADGEVVRPSILWNDTRSLAQTDHIRECGGQWLRLEIGNEISDGLTLGKMLWLRENRPEEWACVQTVLHATNYIAYRLTGVLTADVNNIGQSGMNDVRGNDWSARIMREFDIDQALLPAVHACSTVIAQTSPGAADFGLPTGVPVVLCGGDASAEGYALALAGSSRMKIRLGSAADLNMVVAYDDDRFGIRDAQDGFLLCGTYIKACATTIRWVRTMFYSDEPQESRTYTLMDAEGAAVPVGSEGLILHPYLYGEAAPYFNASLSGMLHGIRAGMGRGHFVRAAYEGVSFALRQVIRGSEAFEGAQEFMLVGGGAGSDLFASTLAEVLQTDLVIPSETDSSFGAALMAGGAIGAWDGRELAESFLRSSRVVRHRPEVAEVLNAQYEVYCSLAEDANRRASGLDREE